MAAYLQFFGRIMLALIFIMAAVGKIQEPAGTAAYMETMNVPSILLWPTIALELLGGLAIVVGYKTRLFAFALAAFTLLAAALFHADFNDKMQTIMFMKDIAIAGGLLLLAAIGKTAFSMDNRRSQTNFFGTRQG